MVAFGEINDAAATRGRRSFEALREQLGATHTVGAFALTDSVIAPDVKVIAVAGTPDSLTAAQLARLRAFLDRGGSLLVMASGMALSDRGPFALSRRVGWNELLKPSASRSPPTWCTTSRRTRRSGSRRSSARCSSRIRSGCGRSAPAARR